MFDIREITKATEGKLVAEAADMRAKGISIDSRTVREHELFVAIKGKAYDGHAFVEDALKKGARGAVIRSGYRLPPELKHLVGKSRYAIIAVPDTLRALGEIARGHRKRFDIPVVAVTGSNGKTTTKEMIGRILREGWLPLKNPGTYNNLIGVPLTLLRLAPRFQSAVLEFGMSRPEEIRQLTRMSEPTIGVITTIGPSHLEGLKNLNAVYQAKKELFDCMGQGDIAIINRDDRFLRNFKNKKLKIVTYSVNEKSDFQAKGIAKKASGWRFRVHGKRFFLPLPAFHDIYNALAAICVGSLFGVHEDRTREALSNYTGLDKRMARRVVNGIEFIDDTYNSNPQSLESAVSTLRGMGTKGKRVLVSGDMLELGKSSEYYHNRIGKLVAHSQLNGFIGVGEMMHRSFLAAKKAGMKNAWHCPSKKEAAVLLKEITGPHDVVLVKGSRAMRMEEVIECFITCSIR